MKLTIRNDKVIVDGYVNAVDRFSKPLRDKNGKFIEKILPGAFARAISKAKNILVLLNHDKSRVLADTKSGKAKLYEDNIGLRAIVEIEDADVIEDAKQGKLRGWSFGFTPLSEDEEENEDGIKERTVKSLELYEVSIINQKKIPAYYGTSIELRNDEETLVEYRYSDEELEVSDETTVSNDLTLMQKREIIQRKLKEQFKEAWVDDLDDKYIYVSCIDESCKLYKIPYSISNGDVSIDIDNKVEVIRGGYVEVRDVPEQHKIYVEKYKERLKKLI